MKQFCLDAIQQLNNVHPSRWAELYVNLKMEFFRKYNNGLICSTVHGSDWFINVLNCLNGMEWDKKEYKGEYEDNFRKLIEIGRKEI